VIVSTHEEAHVDPVLAAVRAGHATLVEKPIALTLDGADALVDAAADAGVDLRVGYSMRYAQRYAVGHQQMVDNKIGPIIGGMARTYDTMAVARAILGRSPTATPAADILTYLVDVIGWYHSALPVEVVARGNGTLLRAEGHDADDITVALVTYDDGSVMSYATSYSLPAGYPSNGMSTRIELIGTKGVLLITEDHGDQVMYTEDGFENAYVDQTTNLAYLGSRTSGEWVGETMFGRVADETRAWLDHLAVGGPCHITTAEEARRTLAVTLAMDESAKTGRPIPVE
jgi:predicted dehydrogenase